MADTDAILRPALEAAIAAERADPSEGSEPFPEGSLIVSYVLVVGLKGFDAEGEDVSYTAIYPVGSMTEQLGLITEAKIRYDAEVLERYLPRG